MRIPTIVIPNINILSAFTEIRTAPTPRATASIVRNRPRKLWSVAFSIAIAFCNICTTSESSILVGAMIFSYVSPF